MDNLRPDQKEFVKEYIDNGGNATQAVIDIERTENRDSAGVIGHRMLRNVKIQELIENQAEGAFSRIVELSEKAKNETVKLSANKDIVDRAGFKPIDRTDLTTQGEKLNSLNISFQNDNSNNKTEPSIPEPMANK
jgi:phage terminase small subunit